MNHDDFEPDDHGPFCLHCACSDPEHVRQNGSGEVLCENCGYSESE